MLLFCMPGTSYTQLIIEIRQLELPKKKKKLIPGLKTTGYIHMDFALHNSRGHPTNRLQSEECYLTTVTQQGVRGGSSWIPFPNPEELLKDLLLYLLAKERERMCTHPQARRGAEGRGEREGEKQTSEHSRAQCKAQSHDP